MKAEKQTGGGVIRRKGIILLSIIILLIITIVVGITYAYWKIDKTQSGVNELVSNCFELEYSEKDNIKLEKTFPILNSEGEKLEPYKITLKNICENETKYQLNLEVLQSENRLDSEYITLKVNNEENKILNEYEQTPGIIEDKAEAYKIYEGHLRKDQVINFEIRLWMGEEVELSDEVVNKTFKSKVTVEAVVENTAGVYKEEILNGADPVLKEGLIPVTINNEGKVTRADTNKKWYNYANQEWANAVILEEDYQDPGEGKEIPEEKIESYFVWIPKYSYQLWDLGEYNSLTEIDETKPHTIPIRFGTTNTTDKKGECATPMNEDNTQGLSKDNGNCKVGDYMTHPAFISFDVNGLWVGKFETSYKSATKKADAQNTTNTNKLDTDNIIIKPNSFSWRNLTIANAYLNSYSYQRELDSHLIKNTEWGAVAYLSHSNYGINKEVRINNNQNYLTGYAAKNQPTIGFTNTNELCSDHPDACNEFGASEKGQDGAYNYNYFNNLSVVASTTGNYTGIYDMSGGAHEYTLSFITSSEDSNIPLFGNSGFANEESSDKILFPTEKKYYDLYKYRENYYDYNIRILGDASGELGPFKVAEDTKRRINSWYDDGSWVLNEFYPWVVRGGMYGSGTESGIFDFNRGNGEESSNNMMAYRIVLAPKQG